MHELAELVDDFRFATLQVADEMPPERIAVDGVLCLQVLRSGLSHYLDPGVDQQCQLLDGDVLRRRDDRYLIANLRSDSLVARADSVRRSEQEPPARHEAFRPCGARR